MQVNVKQWFLSLLAVGVLFLGACTTESAVSSSPSPNSPNAVESPATTSPASPTPSPATSADPLEAAIAANPAFKNLPQLRGSATVEMTIKGQPVTIDVDGTNAPITAGNFVDLVQRGVYNGLAFHRVIREPQPFVVQGGDPQSKNSNVPVEQLGTGSFTDPATSQPRYIPLEIKPEPVNSPIVYGQTFETARINAVPKLKHTRGAVAMARSAIPDSASSQFYFALSELGFLDGNYAVFGYVTDGMDVIDKVQQGDRIESAKVTKGLENLKQPGKA